MRWLFRQRAHSLSSADKEEVRRYLTEELKLAAFKDIEARTYYGTGAPLTDGLPRFEAAVRELVIRHKALIPPTVKGAAENHRAWQATYEAYQRGLSEMARAVRAGAIPPVAWMAEANRKGLAGSKHTGALHRLLGSTPEDLAEMSMRALQSLDAEPWNP